MVWYSVPLECRPKPVDSQAEARRVKIRIDYLSEPTANNIYKVQNYDNKLLDVGLRINWRKIKTNVSGRQLISQRLEKLLCTK